MTWLAAWYWFLLLFAVGVIAGGLLAWFIKTTRDKSEVNRLAGERDALSGEVNRLTSSLSALWGLSELERKTLFGRLSGDKVEKIANDAGYSQSAIEKTIKALKDKGLLQ